MALDTEALKSTVPWYHEKLVEINPDMRNLLEARGVPPEEVLEHVEAIREKAWAIFPYPCIGMFSFTRLHLANHKLYSTTILPKLLSGGTFLDLGCAFSSEIRSLVSVGVPSTSLTGLDNQDGFWNLGKDLFHDHETLKARFVVADMKDLASIPPDMLGTFDIIWAGASFHLFDRAGQVKASLVAAKLLKDEKGSAIYGYQLGRTVGKETTRANIYLHDPETFEEMWSEDVGRELGMEFEVKSWLFDSGVDIFKERDPEIRRLGFAVMRINGPVCETGTAEI